MAKLKLWVSRGMEVVNADAEIEVRDTGGDLIGHLLVSKGSVDWAPKNAKGRYSMRWQKFDRVMTENGRFIR